MTGSMALLEELQRRGFTPDEGGEDWFDLDISRRTVRVALDDNQVTVYVMSDYATDWQVTCSDNNPLNVTLAVIDLAIAHAATASKGA